MKETADLVKQETEVVTSEKESRKSLRVIQRGRRIGLLMMVMSVLLSISAFAEDSAGGVAAVTGAMTTMTSLVTSVFDMITGNPVLVLFLAAGVLGVAIRLTRRLMRAAKGS